MKYNVYSVRDLKVGFGPVFLEQNDEAAARGFKNALANPGGMMNFSPADFSLFRVAEFNLETGVMTPVSPVMQVIDGASAYVDL